MKFLYTNPFTFIHTEVLFTFQIKYPPKLVIKELIQCLSLIDRIAIFCLHSVQNSKGLVRRVVPP